ncbi:hypothetical protein, partial [Enterococcus faecium]|uniref:hypothetical protein n=1 Tax=Enterococcus faecium TaxID=1352 RepID=UPI003DA094B5
NKELAQWNKVALSANFKVGQQVVLYTPAKKRSSVKTSRKNSKTASVDKKSTRTQHSKAR